MPTSISKARSLLLKGSPNDVFELPDPESVSSRGVASGLSASKILSSLGARDEIAKFA